MLVKNKPGKILVIDDDTTIRWSFEGAIVSEGHQVFFVLNGQEALDWLRRELPDLIFLDVMLPDIHGFDLCRQIRQNPHWQHIPIIMMTALFEREELAMGLDVGADDFITKPFIIPELKARTRSMLRIHAQYQELKASLQVREDMAHMIVHDMRTPLNIIAAGSEKLISDAELSPKQRRHAEWINKQVNRLGTFINDLLLMAKIEDGKLPVAQGRVDLLDLVHSTTQNYVELAEERGISIQIDASEEKFWVAIDANLLARVIDNLLSNALKFSPTDGKISIEINSLVFMNNKMVQIRVADQGLGIPPKYRQDVFDKYKVIPLLQDGLVHTGIGLAFCKLVVEHYAGTITIGDNLPLGGTLITVCLPLWFPAAEK